MQVTGSAALVTGAASGLGAATSAALAASGQRVYGLDLQRSIEAAGAPPSGVVLLAADVTDPLAVQAALDQIARDGLALRVSVSCAGIAPSATTLSRGGPHDLDLFRAVVDVNLVGTFNVLRLSAAAMAAQAADDDGQRGVIVNTASIAAFEPQVGQIAYAASKAAVVGMTLAAARDLARHGVRVVTVAPGIVETPMMSGFPEATRAGLASTVPFPRRLAAPSEFARLVEMVIEHDYLNGETIRMDGALRMAAQ